MAEAWRQCRGMRGGLPAWRCLSRFGTATRLACRGITLTEVLKPKLVLSRLGKPLPRRHPSRMPSGNGPLKAMRNIFRLLVVAAIITGSPLGAAQSLDPLLAKLKAAAEAGDAQAQSKLGDAYRAQFDEPNALLWHRKAAAHGVARSQSELGRILMSNANNPITKPEARSPFAAEAMGWYLQAANQGDKPAQLGVGREFEQGKFVKRDYVEAYKWFAVAAEGAGPFAMTTIGAKGARDALLLKMSQDQITEGRKRAAAFTPRPTMVRVESSVPAWVEAIKLQGLSGAEPRRLALINGLTFQKGDQLAVSAGGKWVKIRCLTVGQSSATIAIEGWARPRELKLAPD